MAKRVNPIHTTVSNAISSGTALTARDIRTMRDRSIRAVTTCKAVFWVAIAIFNVLIWVPLPIGGSVLVPLAVLSLAIAFVVPIVGIRKHQKILDLLEDASSGPKKSRAGESGRSYIEQVRKEGRNFVKVEMEVLEGNRTSATS